MQKILYCRVGWMNAYRGSATEKPQGGGEYNKKNIGHEVYNYLGYNGKYYGFVERSGSIHVEKLCGDKKAEYADDILVIWVSRKPNGEHGQYIVGWYRNARVYRNLQNVPIEAMSMRDLQDHDDYNIYSEQVYLIEPTNRQFCIKGMGESNIWYGDNETNQQVFSYVQNYDSDYKSRIKKIEENLITVCGNEKEAVVKIRVNQDKFRDGLLKKYGQCCLCKVSDKALLIASHIKPWAVCDKFEKLDLGNGLLLCPNHDKLFDLGLISFDVDGTILISGKIDKTNRIFMNVQEKMKIAITEENEKYMKYHRENLFQKAEK